MCFQFHVRCAASDAMVSNQNLHVLLEVCPRVSRSFLTEHSFFLSAPIEKKTSNLRKHDILGKMTELSSSA